MDILTAISLGLNIFTILAIFVLFVQNYKTSKIIEQSLQVDKKLNRKISKKLEAELGQKIAESIDTAVADFEKELKSNLSKLLTQGSTTSQQMKNFLDEQQKSMVAETQLLVAQMVNRTEGEIEDYKKNQIEKIEGQINSIVSEAAREVLGRMISITEHEDMVSRAFEKAKRDKFFT